MEALYPKKVMEALATVTYAGTKKNLVESEMVADTPTVGFDRERGVWMVGVTLIFPRETDPFLKSTVKATEAAIKYHCGKEVEVEIATEFKSAPRPAVEKLLPECGPREKLAFAGDGINDAPALTTADTGIAIGAGTDVAIDAADIVLVKSRLSDVTAAIRAGRATIRNIHQNLFWAFFYNAACIPLAMGVYGIAMKPMYGAAAMALSSFFVCMNALRLNLVDIHDASHDKKVRQIEKTFEINKEEAKMTKVLKVDGMMCAHCEARVKKALEAIDGVESAAADHDKGTATVQLSRAVADDVLRKAVEDQEYTVLGIE